LGNSITYPVPRHVVELHGERWTEVEHIVTNGPFKLMSWERDHSISLARNPLFHGQFKGNVHQIEYFVGLEPSRSLAFYEQDKLDLALLWGTVMHETKRRSAANPFYANELVSLPVYATEYMGFDVSRPPFNDRRVRRAFVMAIDRGWWANEVKGGWHSPATGGYIPPGIPGHSPAIGLPYDPVRARQLLAEAGYPNGDGFPPITQVGPIPQSEWYLRLEQLPQRWKSVLGVEIADEVMRWGAYIDRLRTQTPNIFYLGWEADYPDPDNFLRLGIFSYTRGIWRNEAYVRLVEQARRILDQEKRMELYQKADRILIEEAAILPLSYMRYHMLKKPWVNKYPLSPQKSSYWKDVIIEPH
jgi:ABC-type oligopeptide transport system substrate-binding subunit